jgi:protein ImuA
MSESSALIARLRRASSAIAPVRARAAADAWLGVGLARGRLHEVFAQQVEEAASGAGFAVALALVAQAMPLLWLRTEAAERAGGRLHVGGLAELGVDADSILLGIVADEAALLRAAADAARCPGLGTLLVESHGRSPGLDLTATRRLMLAAELSGVTVMVLRVGAEPSPSAAETRWGVSAAPSVAMAANAPGAPAFDVELLRRRGGPAGARWRVEWNRDAREFRQAALSGARLPLAPDRAAARDAAASVRRSG